MSQDTPELTNMDITAGLQYLGWENSPVITNNYTDTQGIDGSTFNNTTFSKSVINAKFLLHTTGHYDMQLARHDIYKIFGTRDLFRIRSDSSPAKVAFVRAGSFSIAPAKNGSKQALITIPFDNPSGYLYSLYTSDNDYLYSSEGWQEGMNLLNGDKMQFDFTASEFKLFNPSDIKVDPYYQHHQLKIIIKFEGDYIKLTNTTNNTSWQLNKPANLSNTVVLDGINTYVDDTPASLYTDFGNIALESGWNNFVVEGATTRSIIFSYPFIYLD